MHGPCCRWCQWCRWCRWCGLPGANNNPTNIAKNQCRANINHNILSPQHAILPHSSQKACRGDLPGWLARSACRLAPLCQQSCRNLFQIVLGLTPRRRAWKACPSQNDDFLPRFGIYPLYTALQGTSIPKRFGTTLFRHLCSPSRPCFAAPLPVSSLHFPVSSLHFPVSLLPVFLTCNVGKIIGLSRTFSSGRVTSGTSRMPFCALRAVVPNRLVKVPPLEGPTGHIRHQTRRFRRVW